MICTLPEMPLMDEQGRPRRPLVLLVGSAGIWQPQAARELDAVAAGVIRTDPPIQGVLTNRGMPPAVILEGLSLAWALSSVVVIWVDNGPVWLWLEMGRWLTERGRVKKYVWGMDATARAVFHHAGHLALLLEDHGWPIYSTLEMTLTAAKVRLQEQRT